MRVHDDNERQSDQMEHRWGQRVPLELPIRLDVGGRPMGPGILRNASISGAFIETALEVPLFTNLAVVFRGSSGSKSRDCRLGACVVRSVLAGFGVEWRDVGSPDIVALIEKAAGQSAVPLHNDRALAPA
jgi:hypothetical protein